MQMKSGYRKPFTHVATQAKQHVRQVRLALFLLVLVLLAAPFAEAATVIFDGAGVSGCTLSGMTYTCASSPTTSADDLNIAGGYVVNISGDCNANSVIAGASSGLNFNLKVADSVALGSGTYLNGTLSAGGTVSMAANASVTGAISGTTVTLAAGAHTGGAITALKEAMLGAGAYVTGDLSAGTTATLSMNAYITGNLTAGTTATLAADAFVCGNLNAITTATLGADAFVCGNLQAQTIGLGANAYVNGNLAGSTATLAAGACYGSASPGLTGAGDHVCPLPRPVTICSSIPPSNGLDHILITHPGTALTCTPQTVSVTACANAACTMPNFSGGVTVVLAPGNQRFSIDGSGVNGKATVWQTTAGTALLSASANVSTASASSCLNQSTGAASCAMTVADAGFLFPVPDHNAETIQSFSVMAVRKSDLNADNGVACTPAFVGLKKVNFSCGYSNPSSGTLPLRMTAEPATTPVALAGSATASCTASGADIMLNFDNAGVASASLIYADAGQMKLNARFVPVSAAEAGLNMTGTTRFIVAPASFGIGPIAQTATPKLANPGAGAADGTAFIKAGEQFNAIITALNATGNTTRNFGAEAAAESITMSSNLVLPAGGSSGTLSSTVPPFVDGVTTAMLRWNEVGIVTLTANLASAGYQGSGRRPTGISGNVGRFYPDHFVTTATAACNDANPDIANRFTYSGQPFPVTVSARNANATVTTNYDGGGRFSREVILSPLQATSAGALSNAVIAASLFVRGEAAILTPAFTFATRASAETPIAVRATESTAGDQVSSLGFLEAGGARILAGRIQIMNANGSQISVLLMPMQAQYWTGTSWQVNTRDVCTGTPPATQNAVSITLDTGLACVLDSGAPGRSSAGCGVPAPVSRQFINGNVPGFAGNFNLGLAVRSAGSLGATTVTATVPDWLKFVWRPGVATNPSGRATFGIFRSGPIIYMRETYQ